MKKLLPFIIVAVMLIAAITACKKEHVTGVKLNETSLSLEIGDTATLVATVYPENAINQSVIFKSSAPSVATVTYDGLVTALSKGVSVIEAISLEGNFSAKCTVQVDESFIIDIHISGADDVIATAHACILGENDEHKVLASTKNVNNSFKLKLPRTIDDKYLQSFVDYWLSIDFFEDIDVNWVSDKNAKLTWAWAEALDINNEHIGQFLHSGSYSDWSYAQEFILYSDRNFTVKGEKIDAEGIPFKCDCSFSKGWNFLYWYNDRDYVHQGEHTNYWSFTTNKPSGGGWYWFVSWHKKWEKTSNQKHFFGYNALPFRHQ